MITPLNNFVNSMTSLVAHPMSEAALLSKAQPLLATLISKDDWLPASHSAALPDKYAQHLLYCDPQERFSVISFVWGPGHTTPYHNHTVWGLVGVLRGEERCDECDLVDGQPTPNTHTHILKAGQIEAVSPTVGDWHKVSNALSDRPSVSIHVYGTNIGTVKRSRLDENGHAIEFVSGYTTTNALL